MMLTSWITGKPYSLVRSFALLGLISIVIITAASALLLGRFLRRSLLERDAVLTTQFVQSIAEAQNTGAYFAKTEYQQNKQALDEFFVHIAHLPDVVRANVYRADGTIVWSDQQDLIGKRFTDNPELRRALAGEMALKSGRRGDEEKAEEVLYPVDLDEFVENYIPIWDATGEGVVGVVEVYKIPQLLLLTIEKARRLVWINAAVGGVFLYAALFWIVLRADKLIKRQHKALLDSEKMSALGEMASSVAHSIRNPLAAIRSSAELALEEAQEPLTSHAEDIVKEVDRLGLWLRDLLVYSIGQNDQERKAAIADVIHNSLDGLAERLAKQGIAVKLEMKDSLPEVQGDPVALTQVFNTLIANALEAMPNGGILRLIGEPMAGGVIVKIIDSGVGISPEHLKKIFEPMVSFRRNGLGIGLYLSRRILQRYGGKLDLLSDEGQGTTAVLQLAAAG